jgi:hypothetical protein
MTFDTTIRPDEADNSNEYSITYTITRMTLNRSYRAERVIVIHNSINGEVLIFRADTKELWTPSHYNLSYNLSKIKRNSQG